MPDACIINLSEAARSVQMFKINAYTATKDIQWYTATTACAVGGLDWQIDFLPNSSIPNAFYTTESDWIKLRLSLISEANQVAASLSCFLVDPNTLERPSHGPLSKEITKSSTFCQNGFQEVFLARRSDLEGSKYLKDDQIIVQCAITVLFDAPSPASLPKITPRVAAPSPSSDLQKHLGELLRSQDAADVTFLVSGEPVPAHRCVLAARSPVFMAELFGDMKENASPSVEIKDMDAEVFRAMLRYVYTDRSPELEQEGEQATSMAQHLLDAADRYGLERLKSMCVDKVCSGISVETVATTLALAELHGCSKLKDRCIEFVLSTTANFYAVAATEGYKHLEASCPSVLTDLLKLVAQGHK